MVDGPRRDRAPGGLVRETPASLFVNYYRCPDDGTAWSDVWSCACNDRCPRCNHEITPYHSVELAGALDPVLQASPENARCSCGNITGFVGIDERGYGGPEVCTCGAATAYDAWLGRLDRRPAEVTPDLAECTCLTVLTQPFRVLRDDAGRVIEIEYQVFSGGGYDAEIGEYTRIQCGRCGVEVYRAPEQTGGAAQ